MVDVNVETKTIPVPDDMAPAVQTFTTNTDVVKPDGTKDVAAEQQGVEQVVDTYDELEPADQKKYAEDEFKVTGRATIEWNGKPHEVVADPATAGRQRLVPVQFEEAQTKANDPANAVPDEVKTAYAQDITDRQQAISDKKFAIVQKGLAVTDADANITRANVRIGEIDGRMATRTKLMNTYFSSPKDAAAQTALKSGFASTAPASAPPTTPAPGPNPAPAPSPVPAPAPAPGAPPQFDPAAEAKVLQDIAGLNHVPDKAKVLEGLQREQDEVKKFREAEAAEQRTIIAAGEDLKVAEAMPDNPFKPSRIDERKSAVRAAELRLANAQANTATAVEKKDRIFDMARRGLDDDTDTLRALFSRYNATLPNWYETASGLLGKGAQILGLGKGAMDLALGAINSYKGLRDAFSDKEGQERLRQLIDAWGKETRQAAAERQKGLRATREKARDRAHAREDKGMDREHVKIAEIDVGRPQENSAIGRYKGKRGARNGQTAQGLGGDRQLQATNRRKSRPEPAGGGGVAV